MKKLRLSKAKIEMKKERKKPHVQTKTYHEFVGNRYGNRVITQEEMDAIIYPLGEFEFKGTGLPEKLLKKGEHPLFDLSFDVRIFHDKEGNLELSFACKNSNKHTIKPFEGLTEKQACQASGDFARNLVKMVKNTCFILADACIKNQTEDFEKKREFCKEAIEYISYQYKILLGLGHYKIIEETEKDGIKTEKSEFIEYGARPQTEEEKEKEKREFLDELYSAFRKLKQNHVENPKQKDLMPYLFKMHTDKEKKISDMFKKQNLPFKRLWLIFNGTDNYDDYLNNAIRIKRVTSK